MNNGFPMRGEIWLVNFNPSRGSEQKGIRPALVIQNNVGNCYAATTIVAALTGTIKVYPVTVFLATKVTDLAKDSMVNLAQILTVDKSRLRKKLGELDSKLMAEVDKALRTSLEL